MKNKKLFSFIMLFTGIYFSVTAQSYNFFKHLTTVDIDYDSGESLKNIFDEFHLENKELVTFLELTAKNANSNSRLVRRTYADGILTHQYSEVFEVSDVTFEYDEHGYLTKSFNHDRVYQSDNSCLVYKNNRIEKKITVEELKNQKNVLIEKQNKDGVYYVSEKYEYQYKDGILDSVVYERYNMKGTMVSSRKTSYEYIKTKLTKKTTEYNGSLRWEYTYTYDDKDNLIQVYQKDFSDEKNNNKVEFSKFDEYGNWLQALYYFGESLYSEINRRIEYK